MHGFIRFAGYVHRIFAIDPGFVVEKGDYRAPDQPQDPDPPQ
jgi:hypothetical protein